VRFCQRSLRRGERKCFFKASVVRGDQKKHKENNYLDILLAASLRSKNKSV
jgi:hypothetical protein